MKNNLRIFVFVAALLLISGVATANDANNPPATKPLSMSTVWTLSLIPINSPALFYVKRPLGGVVTTVLESGGLAMGTLGAVTYATANCTGNCGAFAGWGSSLIMGIGFGTWLSAYIYTIANAPAEARKYNESINSASIVPVFFATPGGGKIGVAGHF